MKTKVKIQLIESIKCQLFDIALLIQDIKIKGEEYQELMKKQTELETYLTELEP